jgi:peptide/nickel transport system substrate-binding protein/oligopeptide transport system substrate-binding protein
MIRRHRPGACRAASGTGRARTTPARLAALACVALLVGGVFLPAVAQAAVKPVRGGSMSFFLWEPAYIDPYNAQESEGTQVTQALFDSLTRVDPLDASKLRAAAATSWTSSRGATVWTFTLNKKDQFSDGQTVTASDFVYAWTRIVDPRTKSTSTKHPDPSLIAYLLSDVKGFAALSAGKTKVLTGVKALSAYRFQVTLSTPCADFPYVVSHPALAPVPKPHVTGGVRYGRKTVAYGEMPVGNGPFMMSKPWSHDRLITIKPNPHYYGAKPYLSKVDFKIYTDQSVGYSDFLAHKLDFAPIAWGQIAAAKAAYGVSANGYTVEPGHQVLMGAEDNVYYLLFNLDDPTMSNPLLRKAISLAIDRQAICDQKYDGTRIPADSIIPPGIAGYAAGAWADSRYDQTAAKQALSDAGYPNGVGLPDIELSFNTDGGHEGIMEMVRSDLATIGVTVTFRSQTFPAYLQQLGDRDFQIGRLGWLADYPSAGNFLDPLFGSGSPNNYSGYTNGAVDAALKAARANTNTASRFAAYRSIDASIGADNPVVPILFQQHSRVGSSRLHGFTWDAMGYGDFAKAWVK